jgi:putative hemolysin
MIPLAVFLLACCAVYLGAIEVSFNALMRLSLRLMADRGDPQDHLGAYLDEPLLLLVPVRLLLGLVTTTATALLARGVGVGGAHTLAIVVLSAGVVVIVCELLLPLGIVRRNPEVALRTLLPSFEPVAAALLPVTRLVARSLASAKRANQPSSQAEQVSEALDETARVNGESSEPVALVEGEERRLLRSIVDFGSRLVREVMTPRPDIVAIRRDSTVADLRALFLEQEYSRFPVYSDSLDNIEGFVFVKDLVALGPGDDSRQIASLMRPVVVVPEVKRVPELLKQFQREQVQCAIVVDEYGGTAGLVTIEDLLEEIVGEIRDEYDVESEPIVDEGNGQFMFSGKVDVDEIAQRLNVQIERQGFETVGGYLLSHLGRVPTVGERFDMDGLNIEVIDAERRRVHRVRISRQQVPEPAPEA